MLRQMKDYTQSIAYMRGERGKQSEAHRKMYDDAIDAMEHLNPMEPIMKAGDPKMHCPRCDKAFDFRNTAEIYSEGERICNNCGQHMAWKRGEKVG